MDLPNPSRLRIDDLENGLFIVQDPASFRFGIDAVLLAHFARARSHHSVLDLGCGQGVLPLLLYALYKPKAIVGIEIQQHLAAMAVQSVRINALEEAVRIECGDYRNSHLLSLLGKFHLVVSNPPYHPIGSGSLRSRESDCISRFEVTSTLSDVVHAAACAIYEGGRFCMVHLPKRLSEIVLVMDKQKLTVKRILMVHPREDKGAQLMLIEGVKKGRPGLCVLPPLFVHGADGKFSKEMLSIYNEGALL
jgi:tRNA1Val (adenine37-N6)-methyltransferase